MRSGNLRHRVTIQESKETRKGDGSIAVTWEDVGTVWASVRPIRATERIRNNMLESEISHRVEMRYRDDITTKQRILFGTTRYFNIETVINPNERNINLELICREEVS